MFLICASSECLVRAASRSRHTLSRSDLIVRSTGNLATQWFPRSTRAGSSSGSRTAPIGPCSHVGVCGGGVFVCDVVGVCRVMAWRLVLV